MEVRYHQQHYGLRSVCAVIDHYKIINVRVVVEKAYSKEILLLKDLRDSFSNSRRSYDDGDEDD